MIPYARRRVFFRLQVVTHHLLVETVPEARSNGPGNHLV